MIVFGWYIIAEVNEDKSIVLSIAIAAFLYLFVPFVLKDENRWAFVVSILERFGFEKKNKHSDTNIQ